MTVAELLARISSAELTEWEEFNRLEPFGEERADLRSAIVAATVAAGAGVKGAKPADFMPKFGPEARPRMTGRQMADFWRMRAALKR